LRILATALICIDENAGKITLLKTGKMPIYELALRQLVETDAYVEQLSFTMDLREPGVGGDAPLFITVGTPSRVLDIKRLVEAMAAK